MKTEQAKHLNISYSYNKKVRYTMKIETTKMSSRGQIVIPQNVRDEIHAEEGTVFLVMTNSDTLILKKVAMPSKEDVIRNLENFAKEATKRVEKLGIKERDIPDLVHKLRKEKNK